MGTGDVVNLVTMEIVYVMTDRLSWRWWVWFKVGTKGTFITRRWAGLFDGNPGNSISTMSYRQIEQ